MDGIRSEQWESMVSSQNPKLLKKAQEELNEDPDRRDEDIQKFREMIAADRKLTCPTDDAFLLRFLRVRKFHHKEAYNLLQQYFSFRIKYPELLVNYRPSANLGVLNRNVIVLLPRRDHEGRKIYLCSIGRWIPNNDNADVILRLFHMCIDHALTEEETQVHGVVVVYNFKNFGLTHARHFLSPFVSKKFAILFQDCLPARFKAYHMVFNTTIFEVVYQMAKPFFNEKTKSRIFFHGENLATLHKHIPPECLPEELGGLQPPTDASSLVQTLLTKDDEIASSVANFGYIGIPNGCPKQ